MEKKKENEAAEHTNESDSVCSEGQRRCGWRLEGVCRLSRPWVFAGSCEGLEGLQLRRSSLTLDEAAPSCPVEVEVASLPLFAFPVFAGWAKRQDPEQQWDFLDLGLIWADVSLSTQKRKRTCSQQSFRTISVHIHACMCICFNFDERRVRTHVDAKVFGQHSFESVRVCV